MILYGIITLLVVFLSFLVGALILDFTRNRKYICFSTPTGFFVLLALLFPGYYLITKYQHDPILISKYYIYYTTIVFILAIIFSVIFYKSIANAIKIDFKNYKLVLLALCFFIILSFIFIHTKIDYRTDDINYYGVYIPVRIFIFYSNTLTYDYQSSYVLYSVLMELSKIITNICNLTTPLNLGFIYNVPGLIGIFIISFTFVDLFNILKNKINSKKIAIVVTLLISLIFLSDYWIFAYPHFTGTLRLIPIILIIDLLTNEDSFLRKSILVSLLIGGLIGLNSSGFFISAIIIYAYLIYSIVNNRLNYLKEIAIMSAYPVSFAVLYYPALLKIFFILYFIFIIVLIFRLDNSLENTLNKFKMGWVLLIITPLLIIIMTYVFNIPSLGDFNNIVTSREFFDNINNFDMVYDLFNVTDIKYLIFNVIFWMLLIYTIIRNFNHMNFTLFLALATIIMFFNPLVYRFISMYITGVAFYRINSLIYNPLVIISIITYLYNQNSLSKNISLLCLIVLACLKIYMFDMERLTFDSNYSKTYHADNKDIETISILENIHLATYENDVIKDEEMKNPYIHDDQIRIASQIYGAQLFVNPKYSIYGGIDNLLEDRFAYTVIENSEFEQVFSRRIPGYDLPDVDYTKACSLAYDKKLDYVIVEAQYNWELQTGLWPCSYQVGEDIGTYRILKMDYEYWDYNISMGYTEVYEVKN